MSNVPSHALPCPALPRRAGTCLAKTSHDSPRPTVPRLANCPTGILSSEPLTRRNAMTLRFHRRGSRYGQRQQDQDCLHDRFPFRLRLSMSGHILDTMTYVKPLPLQEKIDRLMRMLPMGEILAAVPGETVTARAKLCGISRQTYYSWLREEYRPNPKQAHRLRKLTGHSLIEIMGRD